MPVASRQARGTNIVNLLQLQPGERIQAVIDTRDYETNRFLFFATRMGQVKKTKFTEYDSSLRAGLIAIKLREGDELRFDMSFEPGDIQFCNNHLVLHSRTAYEDPPEPERKRHMLRLWLKVDGIRPLDNALIDLDEATGWSRREGILPRGMTMRDGRLIPS